MAEVQPSPAAKTLFVCLMGYGDPPMAYSVIAIPVSSLFENGSEVKFHPIKTWVGDELCYRSGCGFIKSNLYLIGGMKPLYKEPDYDPSFMWVYSLAEYSSSVFSVDLASVGTMPTDDQLSTDLRLAVESARDFKISASMGMLSGKSSPMAVEVGKFFYVLARDPVDGLKEPAFESYNPSDNSWQKLDPPPYLDDRYKCFTDRANEGYVVIGNKICVSTERSSFEYDVDTKEWRPCTLFDDVVVADRFGRPHLREDDEYWFRAHGGDKIPYGSPFGFQEEALIYDGDSLICIAYRVGSLVAYQIGTGGKVVRTQRLTRVAIPPNTICHQLADLGNGYFCYIHTIYGFFEGLFDDYKLCISLFRVWKLPPADGDERFLDYEICSQICSERSIGDATVDKVWFPIGSHAL